MWSGIDSTLSSEPRLLPMSLVFYRPEVAVATYQLNLAVDGKQVRRSQSLSTPILVKGCEGRFAIEDCGTIRLCTPSYYREERPSLIWDAKEGAIDSPRRVKVRRDDPADLDRQQQIIAEQARTNLLSRATSGISATKLKVTEIEQTSLVFGDNCLMWCTSIKPRTRNERSLWRASLESSYDHISTVRHPHTFAEALGAIAFQQRGLLGKDLPFHNPATKDFAQCACLPVVYGPVIYTDHRSEYIAASSSELDFVLRSLFSKTKEHQHQREYRFVLMTKGNLEEDTLNLMVSEEMRSALTQKQGPANAGGEISSPVFKGCRPSPRILRCFTALPPMLLRPDDYGAVFTLRVRANLNLVGVQHRSNTNAYNAVKTVEDVDFEIIEQAIAEESTLPNDARIVKLTIYAGTSSVFTLYDFGGLTGSMRIASKDGQAVPISYIAEQNIESKQMLMTTGDFDGSSFLSHPTQRLTLSYTTANSATTVEAVLSVAEDTCIAINATSEDDTATSSFEIILENGLGVSAPCIELVAAN